VQLFKARIMGALTSKPYAFRGRPWELNSIHTRDIHDIILTPIRMDLRGCSILRVLPRGSSNEWITDRTRFTYDSLTNSRLSVPTFQASLTSAPEVLS